MKRPSLIGLLILVIGVLFLLSQLHLFTVNQTLFRSDVLWPLALVLLGLFSLGGSKGKLPLWPMFLLILGVALALRNAGLAPLLARTSGWNLFWGLFIVFMGLQLVLPRRWRKHNYIRIQWNNGRGKGTGKSKSKWKNIVIDEGREDTPRASNRKWVGDLSIGQHPWVLKDMTLWNGVGDVRLNFGTARIEPGTYHVSIGGWIGDVRILVPDGLKVQIITNLSIGDVTVFGNNESGMSPSMDYSDEDFESAETRIYLNIDLKIGDVQVVRV